MLCCALVMLAGCAGSSSDFEVGREVRLLGAVGTVASEDPQIVGMVQAAQLAVGQYNDNPDSRYEIEFRQFSTDTGPGEAGAGRGDIEQTARLIGVVGPFTAADVNDLGPGFSEAGMPFVVPSVNMDSVPPDGVRSFRRLIANNTQEGSVLSELATGLVSGGIALVTEDSEPGRSFAVGAKQSLEAAARPAVRIESLPEGTATDSLATALIETAPQAVVYGGGGGTGTNLVQSLRSQGFEGRIVVSHQVRLAASEGLGPGVTGSSLCADPASAAAPSFARSFEEDFESAPPMCALEAYEGAWMLLESIEEVEANATAVTEFLGRNNQFRGESKLYEFDDAGELPNAPVWIYESTESDWELSGRSDRIAPEQGG